MSLYILNSEWDVERDLTMSRAITNDLTKEVTMFRHILNDLIKEFTMSRNIWQYIEKEFTMSRNILNDIVKEFTMSRQIFDNLSGRIFYTFRKAKEIVRLYSGDNRRSGNKKDSRYR